MLPRGYSHLGVHDSLEIGLRQFVAFLSECSPNNRFDLRDLRSKIRPIPTGMLSPKNTCRSFTEIFPRCSRSTLHDTDQSSSQVKNQLGVFALHPFFSRQTSRQKLRIIGKDLRDGVPPGKSPSRLFAPGIDGVRDSAFDFAKRAAKPVADKIGSHDSQANLFHLLLLLSLVIDRTFLSAFFFRIGHRILHRCYCNMSSLACKVRREKNLSRRPGGAIFRTRPFSPDGKRLPPAAVKTIESTPLLCHLYCILSAAFILSSFRISPFSRGGRFSDSKRPKVQREREYVSVCKRTAELNLPLEKVFPFPAKICDPAFCRKEKAPRQKENTPFAMCSLA